MPWTPSARARVTESYEAQYADPITFKRGEEFTVTDRDEPWRDNPAWSWVWCSDSRGKFGWAPPAYLERHGATGIGLRDYSAAELTVAAGAILTVEDEQAGWLLCVADDGRRGWVPLECVEEVGREETT